MKIVSYIEARMTSSRLLGKMMMIPASRMSMLEHLIMLLKQIEDLNEIVEASTQNDDGNVIVKLLHSRPEWVSDDPHVVRRGDV